jgi:hypothetical protein
MSFYDPKDKDLPTKGWTWILIPVFILLFLGALIMKLIETVI